MTLVETIQRQKYQLLGITALLLLVYFPVIQRMVLQWYEDENYSHGFLVPLIAGYFIYERRETLKKSPVSPWNPGLVLVVLGLLQLLIGYLATEYFTMRSSLIPLLAGLVLYLFGRDIFRQTVLSIGYLILMIPLPYIVYNWVALPLKLFVTGISVRFLQLIGVVVLREGNILMFPSTTLEVADACSGMRSLVSLVAIGVAFAFLIRTTPFKRFLLIGAAIPVAILTNALRVIATGLLAQHWGAQVAEGFFHELAGLLVFIAALFILGCIGALLREEDVWTEKPSNEPPPCRQELVHFNMKFVVVSLLLIVTGCYKGLHADLLVPLNRPFSSFPAVVNNWQMLSQDRFSSRTLELLKPTDYLSRSYAGPDGTKVQLYIGYHGGGTDSGEIHSPKNCLPGSGWKEISSFRTTVDSEKGKINIVRAIYRQGDRVEQIYYWFQLQDQSLSDEYALKLAEITGSLLHRRRDASFIRITVPAGPETPAIGERFIRDFYPVIREFLPG